jgi:hypothetical protein
MDIVVKLLFWINHNCWNHLIFCLISALGKTVHLNFFFIWLNHKTFILVFFLYESLLFKFHILYIFVMQKYFWVEFAKICLEWAIFFNAYIFFVGIIPFFIFVGNERNRSRILDLLYEINLLYILSNIILALFQLRFRRLWDCRFYFFNLTFFTFGIFSLCCSYIWLLFYWNLILRLLFLFIQCLF